MPSLLLTLLDRLETISEISVIDNPIGNNVLLIVRNA